MCVCYPDNYVYLVQGFDSKEGGGIMLISHLINSLVNIPVSVLMGANLAGEVAEEKFCETTIGTASAPCLVVIVHSSSYTRILW